MAGLGQDFTTNLGLNYRRITALGLTIIAMVTAVVAVTVGSIPFLGLGVPNIVSMVMGTMCVARFHGYVLSEQASCWPAIF